MRCRSLLLFVFSLVALSTTAVGRLDAQTSPPTLESIGLYPNTANGVLGTTLPIGSEVPMVATGFYSDGSTQDLTTSATWTSSDAAVASVGVNTGLVIFAGPGTTEISASYDGVTSATVGLNAGSITLEGIAITPAVAGLSAGSTMQLIGYGDYPAPLTFADLTHELSWTSSNPSVASVSSAGVVTGVAPGTVTITVTMPGFTGTPETASVTVVPAPPDWTLTGNLFHQTAGQTATLLNDGTVLIAGGEDSADAVLNLAQIYSPSTGLFTATAGNMVDQHTLATATLLPDGTVLIAGGGATTGGGTQEDTAEIYNPTTGMFTATANNMSAGRSSATATLLNSGLVLIAGGDGGGTSADLYNPATHTFTPTGALNVARSDATATLLQSGEVLVVGGLDTTSGTGEALSSAELYDPTAGTFTLLTATLAFPRALHSATLLNDGQVLIAGGTSNVKSASTPPGYEELYDPTTQTFLQTGALNAPRIAHNALLLGDGNVLVIGGGAPDSLTGVFDGDFPPQATAEVYNPATGEFTFTANMNFSRGEFTATLLENGSVLAAGGEGDILFPAPAEIYTPTSAPPALVSIAVTPTAPSITAGNTQAFTATGTYSDTSTQNITSAVTWISSNTVAATIVSGGANAGIATGVAAGTSTITAMLAGITSNSATLTVTAAATITPTVTVLPSTSSITTTQSLSVTVTVSGGSGNPTPTGSVTLSSGSYTSAATSLVGGSAMITVPAGSLATGTDTLTATYTPDSNSSSTYNSAMGTNMVTVTVATVQITLGTSPAGLSFSVDGTAYAGTQVLTWNVGSNHTIATTSPQTTGGTQNTFASWSDAGAISHSVTAPSSATSYTATFTTSYQLTIAASPASGGTFTPASGTYYASGMVVDLMATPNSGYTFTNWTGSVTSASNASTTITMSAPESVTANFAAVAPPSFTVSSTTPAQTVEPGGSAMYSITVTPQNGAFTSAVTLSASGLPPGATATFSPASPTPGNSPAISQLTIQTASSSAAFAHSGLGGTLAVMVLPLFGLCWIGAGGRRRRFALCLAVLASLSVVAALNGCGGKGFGSSTPAPQNYTITVTGTSGAEQQTTTVQLTVE